MARMTENLNLQRAALRHLDENPFIRILDKTKVEAISNDGDGGNWPLVHLANGQVLRARLLVSHNTLYSAPRLMTIVRLAPMVSTLLFALSPESRHTAGHIRPMRS